MLALRGAALRAPQGEDAGRLAVRPRLPPRILPVSHKRRPLFFARAQTHCTLKVGLKSSGASEEALSKLLTFLLSIT